QPDGDGPVAVARTPVWGLGGTIAAECPELACARVDLARSPFDGEIEALARELSLGGREEQVALRPGGRFVARLVRCPGPTAPAHPAALAHAAAVSRIDLDAFGARHPERLHELTRAVREAVETGALASTSPAVRAEATYLVTGGLGGLGRHAARWLVERGAR